MTTRSVDTLKTQLEEDVVALDEILRRADPLPPSHVRISASAVVRRWLVEGQLNRLAHAIGATLTLPTFDTAAIVAAIEVAPAIRFFLTGGVMMDGLPIQGYYVSDAPFEGRPPIPIDTMPIVQFSPARFLKVRKIYYDSQWFDVHQIVQFIANKQGGVHFDESRQHDWQNALERAATFFTVGNPDGVKEMQLIETREPTHSIRIILPREIGHVWSCLDIELLSAAQALANVHCNGQPLFVWNSETSARPASGGIVRRLLRKLSRNKP